MLKISSYAIVDTTDSIHRARRHARKPEILEWVLVLGLCSLLIFAVLAFGAVDEWSTFVFEAGAAVLFLVWAGKQVVSRQVKLSKNPLHLPALLFLGLILAQVALRRSAYGYVTEYEALQYISYGIVLLIGAECIKEEEARKIFAFVMIFFGAGYAFFALVQELTANGKIFWVHSPQFHGSIYGSYVNHDHYAGLMEMLVPLPFVVSMGHLLRGGQRVLVAFCAVLMASTIFLSGSRGGMLAFVLEMVLFAALTLGKRRSPRIALGLTAVCVLILALLIFLGKGQVLGRLGDLSPGIRLNITKDSLRMFSQKPIWGWGLGSQALCVSCLPVPQSPNPKKVDRRYDHATMTIVMSGKIPAGEFKAKCLQVIDEVQRLRMPVIITKRGMPVAKLVPLDEHPESFIGSMKGTMEIIGDIVAPVDVTWEADAG